MEARQQATSTPSSQEIISMGGVAVTVEEDLAGDDAWFEKNPSKRERRRRATAAELQLSGHAPGTFVLIKKIAPGVKARVYPNRRSQMN